MLDFLGEIVRFEVIGSGSLVSGECRAMEGDGGKDVAMGGR